MENKMKKAGLHYESPHVEVIEVEVEKGFASSSGETGGTGEDMGWG